MHKCPYLTLDGRMETCALFRDKERRSSRGAIVVGQDPERCNSDEDERYETCPLYQYVDAIDEIIDWTVLGEEPGWKD